MNKKAILQYLNCFGQVDEKTNQLIDECIVEVQQYAHFKVVHQNFSLTHGPIGIQELRDLIKRLNENQITVLVSSHNLAEIQHIASYIGIIINGKLKYEGEINDTDDLETIFMNVTKEEECFYV